MLSLADPRWYAALPAVGPGPSVRWGSDAFRAELGQWVEEALGESGLALAGMEDVHQRPWSTVWKVTATDGSTHWAKQNCPHQQFEARLLPVLHRLAPDRVVPVEATDPARGLILLADQGAVFAVTVAPDDLDAWCRLAAEAMLLQRELEGHQAELVEAGLSPVTPSDAVVYVQARAAALAALPGGDARRLAPGDLDRLTGLLPTVAQWSTQLAGLGLPDTLVHNDLHANNVFATPQGMRFFDFGDAVLAHPLSALLVPLNVLLHRLEATPDDARLVRVAAAGLEVWSDVAPVAELWAALPAALHLARLAKAESWLRVTATLTPEELTQDGDSGTWWLAALGDPTPVGVSGVSGFVA
ncbi:MAG: phosphotransferase [Humibacillus sp.]